jgi:hypothetical protein
MEHAENRIIDVLTKHDMYVNNSLDDSMRLLYTYIDDCMCKRLLSWRNMSTSHKHSIAHAPHGSELHTWYTFLDYLRCGNTLSSVTVANQLNKLPQLVEWVNTEYNPMDTVTIDDVCKQLTLPGTHLLVDYSVVYSTNQRNVPWKLLKDVCMLRAKLLDGKALPRTKFICRMLDFAELQYYTVRTFKYN